MITYVNPAGSMELLTQLEVDQLKQAASGATYQLFRNCSLAVLNCGSHTDSSKEILEKHKAFDINVIRRERGVKLELFNAPEAAFVDGEAGAVEPIGHVPGVRPGTLFGARDARGDVRLPVRLVPARHR